MLSSSDPREFHKNMKKLAANTPQDKKMKIRQKKGQLRIGDVILLSYREEINRQDLQEQRYNNALQSMQDNVSLVRQQEMRKMRNLAPPDFIYKGVLYTDGVTDQGINDSVLCKRVTGRPTTFVHTLTDLASIAVRL